MRMQVSVSGGIMCHLAIPIRLDFLQRLPQRLPDYPIAGLSVRDIPTTEFTTSIPSIPLLFPSSFAYSVLP